VVCIDKHSSFGKDEKMNFMPNGVIDKTGDLPLQDRITDIYNCEFFIGLGSGLSWLAWALGKEVILISGFSDPESEFYTPYRVINREVCNSCWNKEEFDKGNWNWCPYHEGAEREFECSKEITFEMVKKQIDRLL
jgi:autotransporter strand-loop-strand O-heptosyltransferase